jgi:4-amino-4-deoxy-L-arabinose transferase-like glycosyltransferase
MLFCFFFVLTIYFGARSLLRKGNPYEILFAYAFMALATLAKGLIGVVLPGLLFIAFVLSERDWRLIAAAKLPLGIPIFLLVAGPWFYAIHQSTDGKWLSDFIYIHHIRRYTARVGHRQPFYYYFITLPLDFLPWTIFLASALVAYRSYRRTWADPVSRFFFLWFLAVFVFFELSNSKRELYLLPLLPPLALLVGNYLDALATNRLPQDLLLRRVVTVCFAIVGVCGIALPIAAWWVRPDAFQAILVTSVVLAVGGICAAMFVWRRMPLKALACVTAMMVAIVLSVIYGIFPYLEQFKSDRPFAQMINRIVPSSAPLYVYADTMDDFNYYSEREVIPVIRSSLQVEKLSGLSENSYLLIKDRDLKRMPMIPAKWIVATDSTVGKTWYLIEFKKGATTSAESR